MTFICKYKGRTSHPERRHGLVPVAVLVLLLRGISLAEAPCERPPGEKLEEVKRYLARLNRLPSDEGTISAQIASPKSCFWRITFTPAGGAPEAAMYLAPDFNYLTTTLLDLAIDPLAEEHKRRRVVAAALSAGTPPSIGGKQNPVSIVEFSDFECPFCKRQAEILKNEVLMASAGQVVITYRYFPLSIHSWAREAAEVASCASEQRADLFWTVHDYLFSHQSELAAGGVYKAVRAALGETADADLGVFDACVSDHVKAGTVRTDEALGRALGVQATPTIFINGVMLKGLHTAVQILAAVREARGRHDCRHERERAGSLLAPRGFPSRAASGRVRRS